MDRCMGKKPEPIPDPIPDPVPDLNIAWLELKTPKWGIEHHMYNKIRILFDKYYKNEGYPLRFAHYIGYAHGLGFWLPYWHVIDEMQSVADWTTLGVDTLHLGAGLTIREYTSPEAGTGGMDRCVPWRSLKIRPVPNDLLSGILHFIPFQVDEAIVKAFGAAIGHHISLFENMGFFGTLNNKFILHNWDKIYMWLAKHGY